MLPRTLKISEKSPLLFFEKKHIKPLNYSDEKAQPYGLVKDIKFEAVVCVFVDNPVLSIYPNEPKVLPPGEYTGPFSW